MNAATLERTTFRTSRLLDFCSRKELIAQTGHQPDAWPLVALKELLDNSLDATEEANVAPVIKITVNNTGITVADNGPGIPEELIDGVLDFSVRVSSREAYVAPDRGAQGNALKTIGTLRRSNRRYSFRHHIEVVDLGLRLADVEKYDLASEYAECNGYAARENLRQNGATGEEIAFLVDQRVELNAFASDEFIEWVEGKLDERGIKKVVPDDEILETAYRRAVEAGYIQDHATKILERAAKHAEASEIPDDLKEQIADLLEDTPETSWDRAVYDLVNAEAADE